MVELIYNTLSSLQVPVRYGWYDGNLNQPHVTYFIALESPSDHEDDDISLMDYTVQVDSWSKEDDTEIVNSIKELMKQANFSYLEGRDLFETDTKIYHKALRFNYTKEV